MTDTELLDMLAEAGESKMRWLCRESTTGRGLRLHQVAYCTDGVCTSHPVCYETPREAMAAYLLSPVSFMRWKEFQARLAELDEMNKEARLGYEERYSALKKRIDDMKGGNGDPGDTSPGTDFPSLPQGL